MQEKWWAPSGRLKKSTSGLFGSGWGANSVVAMIYKRTGNIRAVQILLGHTKLDSTVRYLGVDVEDALALSEATDL